MKTLELENYGVQEMSMQEMKEVDGGFGILAALLAFGIGVAIGYFWTRDGLPEAQ